MGPLSLPVKYYKMITFCRALRFRFFPIQNTTNLSNLNIKSSSLFMSVIKTHQDKRALYILNTISAPGHSSVHSFYCRLTIILRLHLIARLLPSASPQTLHHQLHLHRHVSPLSPSLSELLPPPGSQRVFGCCIPRRPIRAASDSAGTGFACLGNTEKSEKKRAKEIRRYTRQNLSSFIPPLPLFYK